MPNPKEPAIRISRHADIGKVPLWKNKDLLSQKQGPHATIYFINGDTYIGDWSNNQKHGKGTYYYKGNGYQYEGEFDNDMRSGNGTLSIPIHPKKAKDALGDSEVNAASHKAKTANDAPLRKVYTGAWANDKRHGFGTYFYPDGSVYQGNWANDMKEGWGRLTYANGNIYEGEFHREKRHGQGVLLLSNGDRYDGMWLDDTKEGPGKYIYLSKRQCLEGEWSKDMPKCGTLVDLAQLGHDKKYLIPPVSCLMQLKIKDPQGVIEAQKQIIYEERAARLMGPA